MRLNLLGSTRFDWVRIPHAGKSSQPRHLGLRDQKTQTAKSKVKSPRSKVKSQKTGGGIDVDKCRPRTQRVERRQKYFPPGIAKWQASKCPSVRSQCLRGFLSLASVRSSVRASILKWPRTKAMESQKKTSPRPPNVSGNNGNIGNKSNKSLIYRVF
jgi:hypothetical protein